MASKSVVVIGAGVVGVMAARWLQREGHRVTLLDPQPPGRGASFGNAGCFSPGSIVPLSSPDALRQVPRWLMDPAGPLALRWRHLPFALPWLLRFVRSGTAAAIKHEAEALSRLLAPVYECLQPLLRDSGAEDLVRQDGSLVVYATRAGWELSQRGWMLRRRNGVVWEELGPNALHELDPALTRGLYRGAFLPGNGHTVDPHALVIKLSAAFQRAGGRFVPMAATGFVLNGSRLIGVKTQTGVLEGEAAVLAAGVHSRRLARLLGDPVPLESERGYHLTITQPAVMPRLPTLSAEGRFVATPMAMGLRLTGVVELAGLRAAPNWRRAHALLPSARAVFPGLTDAGGSVWLGHRPSTPDSLPVLGRSHRSPDIIYAFGHGHLGLTGGPTTARIVSELIGTRTPSIDLAPFAASRFRNC